MRKCIVLAIILLTGISCSSQNKALEVERRIQNIENGLAEFTTPMDMFEPDSAWAGSTLTLAERMAHYRVPGVSIAVVNDNDIEWAKGYGTAEAEADMSVTTETVFQAASTSKLVTAVIALHFVEQEKLGLDVDVNQYLKSWKIPENEFTGESKVTLRYLLTHQAGLPVTNFDREENADYPTLIQVLNGESPAVNEAAGVGYVPGTRWQYSNLGCLVIQQLLEDISGRPFAEIARETLFEPLGMTSSTFVYPLEGELQEREAMPHDAEGIAREPAMHLTALAHGGLMTTPSDLARLSIDLMRAYQGLSGPPPRSLSQGMAQQLFRRELDLDPRMFGVPLGEGLGVLLYGEGPDFLFAHPGSNLPGTNCWLIGSPESGKSAVIMTNGAMGEVLAMEILRAIMSEYRWSTD
jgi:CubicO group peptidase (beta-lactamase class C family)